MNIKDVIFSAGTTGFFFDDQRAIKQGAEHDGFVYTGKTVTEGFKTVRQAGESISIMLVLENGQVAVGDAAAVQYSGAGGRDPLFLAETYIPFMNTYLKPLLIGRSVDRFKELTEEIDNLIIDDRKLHTAIRYGISQALLDATALANNKLKAEVICDEYQLPAIAETIPIFGQSGDDRYNGVDKMILKKVDILPHGLINNIDEKLGRNGEKLSDYIKWLANRIQALRIDDNYQPKLHIDVYGNIGPIFDNNITKIADYLISLEEPAGEFDLYIEGPVDMEAKEPQIEMLENIHNALHQKGAQVKIVADEWCNTFDDICDFTDTKCCDMVQIKTPDLGSIHNIVESILYCKKGDMESYQGGTCNETDISSRTCVNIAVAARPERLLAKPGMGFDEGFAIVKNEMSRIVELLTYKHGA